MSKTFYKQQKNIFKKKPEYSNLFCDKKCKDIRYEYNNKICKTLNCFKYRKRNTYYCKEHHIEKLNTLCKGFKQCGCRCENNKHTNIDYCLQCYFDIFETNQIPYTIKQSILTLPDEVHFKNSSLNYINNYKNVNKLTLSFERLNYFDLLPVEILIKIITGIPLRDLLILINLNITRVIDTFYIYYVSGLETGNILYNPIYTYKFVKMTETEIRKYIIKKYLKVSHLNIIKKEESYNRCRIDYFKVNINYIINTKKEKINTMQIDEYIKEYLL